jgi:hypothetical protein
MRAEETAMLRELELDGRRTAGELSDGRSGLWGQVRQVESQLLQNRLDDPPTSARMQRLGRHLGALVGELLPESARRLDALHRAARGPAPAGSDREESPAAPAAFETALAAALAAHESIDSTLRAMLAELDEWRRESDRSRVLNDLLAAQRRLRDRTEQLGAQSLSQSLEELSPQQRADLAVTAREQRQLARPVEALLESGSTPGSPDDDAPPATIGSPLGDQIRQAADQILANQIGRALASQSDIIRQLAEAVSNAGSALASPEEALRALEQRRDLVQRLTSRQAKLVSAAEELKSSTAGDSDQGQRDVIRRGQGELSAELSGLADDLRRDLLPEAARNAGRAAAFSREAAAGIDGASPPSALTAQRRVLDELSELDARLLEAQQEAARLKLAALLAALPTLLEPLHERQQELARETGEIESERQVAGRLSRTHLRRIRDAAEAQRQVAAATAAHIADADGLPLVASVLEDALVQMQAAADQLDRRVTDGRTSDPQHAAAAALEMLLGSLAAAQASVEDPHSPPTPPEAGEGGQAAGAAWVEIHLLRSLQADLLARTQSARERAQSGQPAESPGELERLAAEQEALARKGARWLQELQKPLSRGKVE